MVCETLNEVLTKVQELDLDALHHLTDLYIGEIQNCQLTQSEMLTHQPVGISYDTDGD